MTWGLHDHQPWSRGHQSRPDQIKVYWRIVGPSQKPITCALWRTAAGLEVRAAYGADELLRSQRVESEVAAEAYAGAWKAMDYAQGGFTLLDIV